MLKRLWFKEKKLFLHLKRNNLIFVFIMQVYILIFQYQKKIAMIRMTISVIIFTWAQGIFGLDDNFQNTLFVQLMKDW